MILAIVTFKLPKRLSVQEASAIFSGTAPRYLGKAGLVRKHYYVSEAGDRAGGIYLWQSKADAEACYTAEWKKMVAEKYGAPPEIFYAHVPITVDNVAEQIQAA